MCDFVSIFHKKDEDYLYVDWKSNQIKYQADKKNNNLKRVSSNLCESFMNLIVTKRMVWFFLYFRKCNFSRSLRKFDPTKYITFSCVRKSLFKRKMNKGFTIDNSINLGYFSFRKKSLPLKESNFLYYKTLKLDQKMSTRW